MRIAIDGRLLYHRRAGIGQYILRLTDALCKLAPEEHFMFLNDRRHRERPVQADNLRYVPLYTPSHHRWEEFSLPAELFPLRLDLLHGPDFVLPIRRTYAGVITVHDLAFLRFPEWVTPEAARYYRQVHEAVDSAEKVIAVSECTRRDLQELLDVPAEKISVIYEAAGQIFQPREIPSQERRVFKGRHLAPDSFALFVSTIEPRKNIPTLLRAFRQMLNRYPDLDPHPRLILAGAQGWLQEQVFGLINELDLAQEVAYIGPVSQDELVWLYNAARCFVFPSFYEGFGLPPLEAMASGTPVLVSNAGSLPEVVGEAGLLADPQDVDGWTERLARLWGEDELRQALRQQGLERAAQFSWKRAAGETLAAYREAVTLRESSHA